MLARPATGRTCIAITVGAPPPGCVVAFKLTPCACARDWVVWDRRSSSGRETASQQHRRARCCRLFCTVHGPAQCGPCTARYPGRRSEEHTSELQSLMRTSYALLCVQKSIIHEWYTLYSS